MALSGKIPARLWERGAFRGLDMAAKLLALRLLSHVDLCAGGWLRYDPLALGEDLGPGCEAEPILARLEASGLARLDARARLAWFPGYVADHFPCSRLNAKALGREAARLPACALAGEILAGNWRLLSRRPAFARAFVEGAAEDARAGDGFVEAFGLEWAIGKTAASFRGEVMAARERLCGAWAEALAGAEREDCEGERAKAPPEDKAPCEAACEAPCEGACEGAFRAEDNIQRELNTGNIINTGLGESLNQENINKPEEIKRHMRGAGEPAPRRRPKEGPVFIRLPCLGGEWREVLEAEADRWSGLYPAIDVRQCLRSMLGWLEANPRKLKTARGVDRFIVNWLGEEQNRGGPGIAARRAGGESEWSRKSRERREMAEAYLAAQPARLAGMAALMEGQNDASGFIGDTGPAAV